MNYQPPAGQPVVVGAAGSNATEQQTKPSRHPKSRKKAHGNQDSLPKAGGEHLEEAIGEEEEEEEAC